MYVTFICRLQPLFRFSKSSQRIRRRLGYTSLFFTQITCILNKAMIGSYDKKQKVNIDMVNAQLFKFHFIIFEMIHFL